MGLKYKVDGPVTIQDVMFAGLRRVSDTEIVGHCKCKIGDHPILEDIDIDLAPSIKLQIWNLLESATLQAIRDKFEVE